MLFLSAEDFFEKASHLSTLSRADELVYAEKMLSGDTEAREVLISAYLPHVAAHIKRLSPDFQTLGLVMRCYQALEKAIDSFDFLQDGETFSHRLSWYLRQATTRYITEK